MGWGGVEGEGEGERGAGLAVTVQLIYRFAYNESSINLYAARHGTRARMRAEIQDPRSEIRAAEFLSEAVWPVGLEEEASLQNCSFDLSYPIRFHYKYRIQIIEHRDIR